MTGSNLGYICIWDIPDKSLLRIFRISNPYTPKTIPFENVNYIKSVRFSMLICSFSAESGDLLLHEVKVEQPPVEVVQPKKNKSSKSKGKGHANEATMKA